MYVSLLKTFSKDFYGLPLIMLVVKPVLLGKNFVCLKAKVDWDLDLFMSGMKLLCPNICGMWQEIKSLFG